MSIDDECVAVVEARPIWVEFGWLTREQQAVINLYAPRALGVEWSPFDDGVLVAFWPRSGETDETLFDDVRGWAIGNGLPIRGVVDV